MDSSGTGTRRGRERGPRESREEHEIADGQPRGRGRGGEEMTTVWGHGEPRRERSASTIHPAARNLLGLSDEDTHRKVLNRILASLRGNVRSAGRISFVTQNLTVATVRTRCVGICVGPREVASAAIAADEHARSGEPTPLDHISGLGVILGNEPPGGQSHQHAG